MDTAIAEVESSVAKSVAALATLDTARDVNIARGLTRIVEGRRRQKQQKKKQPED